MLILTWKLIDNGEYEIKSDRVRLFGEDAKGKSIIAASPFSEVPNI